MLKLTAAVAAFTLTAVAPIAQARPDEAPASDIQTASPRVSKTIIEEVAPTTPPARRDLKPIVLTPTDWPRLSTSADFISDPAAIAAIPTWPTWYESVYLPSQTRYAATYGGKAAPGAQTDSPPVNWGPDVVPIVEVLPQQPSRK